MRNQEPQNPQTELTEADKKEINRDLLDAILYGRDNTEQK